MSETNKYHRFLDEAGDTTFFGKGKIPILGQDGVSKVFIIGMLKINEPLPQLRNRIIQFQNDVQNSAYYKKIPSVVKRIEKGGFYFHAKDDLQELRKEFLNFINTINCSFQAVVGDKKISRFINKHNSKEQEFYADLLSHLIKDKLILNERRLVLNIAERKNSTAHHNLQFALDKAIIQFKKKNPEKENTTKINFNVLKFSADPILSIADYFCWTIQRVFEKGETKNYDFVIDKIKLVLDVYDTASYGKWTNYYTIRNPLTEANKKEVPQTP
jgi:hypothetical protein